MTLPERSDAGGLLRTERLDLVPMTCAMVEAVILGRRDDAERLIAARMPDRWPNRAIVERAFPVSLDALRAAPEERLWGGRVLVCRTPGDEARVVGSFVFHGRPGGDGVAEIAYGVEEASQRQGYATEAVEAAVTWALRQPGVRAVQATTPEWHAASLRVLEKVGMRRVGTRDHETLGELLVLERR